MQPKDDGSAAEEVLSFWEGIGFAGWYRRDDAVDRQIAGRYGATWERARDGGLKSWLCSARGTLAYLIVTDQFPRNMFRGDARSFATDRLARVAAKAAIDHDWDTAVAEPLRQFFYMPLEHSENLIDQDRSVRLISSRMPENRADLLPHALAHREVIRRFGRFPFRNQALGRKTTEEEAAWMESGAYGAEVERQKAALTSG